MRGGLYVTVIVKATLLLVPDQVMQLAPPEPVLGGVVPPYLPGAEVFLRSGYASAAPPSPAPALAARLAIVGDEPRLDKQVLIYPRAPAVPSTIERASLLSSSASVVIVNPQRPSEASGLGAVEATLTLGELDGALEVPDGVAWAGLHRSREDQRMAFLLGDEWVVLDGMRPDRARLQSRLPGCAAQVRVYPPGRGARPQFTVAMCCDRLEIDAEGLRCALTWRGSFPVASVEAARSVTLLGAVEMPGQPSPWPDEGEVIAAPLEQTGRHRPARGLPAQAREMSADPPTLDGATRRQPAWARGIAPDLRRTRKGMPVTRVPEASTEEPSVRAAGDFPEDEMETKRLTALRAPLFARLVTEAMLLATDASRTTREMTAVDVDAVDDEGETLAVGVAAPHISVMPVSWSVRGPVVTPAPLAVQYGEDEAPTSVAVVRPVDASVPPRLRAPSVSDLEESLTISLAAVRGEALAGLPVPRGGKGGGVSS